MSNSFRRILAWATALLICISPLPFPALATDTTSEETVASEDIPIETPPEETISGETVPDESLPTESVPEETVPEETVPEESLPEAAPAAITPEPAPPGPGLFFGLLHSHSSISEGTSAPEDLFRSAAEKDNMDFFAVTDLSDSFDGQSTADIHSDATAASTDWATGKAAAANVTARDFVGIFGYEMGWPDRMDLGHISTFATPGFLSPAQEDYRHYATALPNYYDAVASVSGSVSQFNHPQTGRTNFQNFAYDIDADRVISLLEVDLSAANPLRFYVQALDAGWHLAPTAAQSIYSSSWRDNGTRTAVYAETLTEEGLVDALRLCRVYATQDRDLQIQYTMDGYFMGSRPDHRHVGSTMDISLTVSDATDGAACYVEVITGGGRIAASGEASAGRADFSIPTASGYWFLTITQPDGDIAVTAPVWVDGAEELGITALTC